MRESPVLKFREAIGRGDMFLGVFFITFPELRHGLLPLFVSSISQS
jgi:hypothetical protein